jgi:hypothetical protein
MSRVNCAKFVHWRFVRMRLILDEPAKLMSGRPPCPVRSTQRTSRIRRLRMNLFGTTAPAIAAASVISGFHQARGGIERHR